MTVIFDAREYGWGSRKWILQKAIEQAPQENKDKTLQSLVEILNDPESAVTARYLMDIIAQGVLTGVFIPTAYPAEPEPEVQTPSDDGLHPESDNPANPLTDITEGEIQSFLADMDEKLGDGIDPFTQKPKSWDFLDEHA